MGLPPQAQMMSMVLGLLGTGYFGEFCDSRTTPAKMKEKICRCGKPFSSKKAFCSRECCFESRKK